MHVSGAKAANAVACWAARYSGEGEWTEPASNDDANASQMLDLAADLLQDEPGVDADREAVQLCRAWYLHHDLLGRCVRDAMQLSSEELCIVMRLGKWAPLQQWLEKVSVCTPATTTSCLHDSWLTVNAHFQTIQGHFHKHFDNLNQLLLNSSAQLREEVSAAFAMSRDMAYEEAASFV